MKTTCSRYKSYLY